MKIFSSEENESIKQTIYRNLKYNIMSLNLKPGEKISEANLQKVFNTSKSPIRESLAKLKEEKLIYVIPQKGTFVSKIELDRVEATLFIRKVVEKEVLNLVLKDKKDKKSLIENLKLNLTSMKTLPPVTNCSDYLLNLFQLDKKFHELIFDFIDKKEVWNTIISTSTHYERFRVLETPEDNNISFILEQHSRIIALIESDLTSDLNIPETSQTRNFRKTFEALYEQFPNYFSY